VFGVVKQTFFREKMRDNNSPVHVCGLAMYNLLLPPFCVKIHAGCIYFALSLNQVAAQAARMQPFY
jgi:hypothetical protein